MKHRVYWIEGDGIGPEIWRAARPVIDAALDAATGGDSAIEWIPLLAGHAAERRGLSALPPETLEALGAAQFAIKGPLETPVGGGRRSLNVELRRRFDLYACVRPVRWFPGVGAPVRHPENVDMVVFRENTEDVYAGIEFEAGSPQAGRLAQVLGEEFGASLRPGSAIGIKPMSEFASKRLVRRAIAFAIRDQRPSVTLVHKGNIMKSTEGAFRRWGYEVAAEEFPGQTVTEEQAFREGANGRLVIRDRIADAMFQEALLRPQEHCVLALPNLNGDYLSDALAAQVGGLGMAPGANLGDRLALFEATHGTAPAIAGKDLANPCSLILSGAMLLDHLGEKAAAGRVRAAVLAQIQRRRVTADLASQMEGAEALPCSAFGQELAREAGR